MDDLRFCDREPLSPQEAKKLILSILATGRVVLTKHFKERVALRGMDNDLRSVLRGGVVDEAEFEDGTWRHKVQAGLDVVVIAFRSEQELAVLTTMRLA